MISCAVGQATILCGAGPGDDTLVGIDGDYTRVPAADTFISGTWITGAVPTVHDYDPTVDQLVLYYDPAVNPTPVVTVDTLSAGGATIHSISLDGALLMQIDAGTAVYTIDPLIDIQTRTPAAS